MAEVSPCIIGITGGIGSGKSVVSRILRLNNERVYDCDTEARRLMECDEQLICNLTDILGEETFGGEGRLNRKYVAEKIFGDEKIRSAVNKVVHRAVKEDFMRYASLNGGRVFCESAILATAGFDKICHKIWLVTAPESERIERVILRNGLSREEIEKRMASQKIEFDHLPVDKVVELQNGPNDLLLPQIYGLIKSNLIDRKICLEKF